MKTVARKNTWLTTAQFAALMQPPISPQEAARACRDKVIAGAIKSRHGWLIPPSVARIFVIRRNLSRRPNVIVRGFEIAVAYLARMYERSVNQPADDLEFDVAQHRVLNAAWRCLKHGYEQPVRSFLEQVQPWSKFNPWKFLREVAAELGMTGD